MDLLIQESIRLCENAAVKQDPDPGNNGVDISHSPSIFDGSKTRLTSVSHTFSMFLRWRAADDPVMTTKWSDLSKNLNFWFLLNSDVMSRAVCSHEMSLLILTSLFRKFDKVTIIIRASGLWCFCIKRWNNFPSWKGKLHLRITFLPVKSGQASSQFLNPKFPSSIMIHPDWRDKSFLL